MRIFLAGASGVIGIRLLPLLVGGGHELAGMTRSDGKAAALRALGAQPVVYDVYDAAALRQAVVGFDPDAVMHQLTDLPTRPPRSRSTASATTERTGRAQQSIGASALL
jgi:uncharacterized protein YbjT (DUF2867 family)